MEEGVEKGMQEKEKKQLKKGQTRPVKCKVCKARWCPAQAKGHVPILNFSGFVYCPAADETQAEFIARKTKQQQHILKVAAGKTKAKQAKQASRYYDGRLFVSAAPPLRSPDPAFAKFDTSGKADP